MTSVDSHSALCEACIRNGLGIDASELHGALTGYLAAGGSADADDWIDRLELMPASAAAAADPTLRDLFERTANGLRSFDAPIVPRLPSIDAPIPERAEAVAAWTRGLLAGFGLGHGFGGHPVEAGMDALLRDLSMIAHTGFDYADAREDAAALAEITRFLGESARLLARTVEVRNAQRVVH